MCSSEVVREVKTVNNDDIHFMCVLLSLTGCSMAETGNVQ